MTTDSNSKPNCNIYANGAWQTAAIGGTALSLNTWSHIFCNYDGTNIKVWVNGVNKGTQANTNSLVSSSSTALYLARDSTTGAGTFQGYIDEVKIYNYYLSDDEIKTDYNRGAALQLGTKSSGTGNTASSTASSQVYCIPGDTAVCSPPIAEWNFNEGVGSSAYDTSGNGNNGALGTGNSAPTWVAGKIGKALSFDGNDYVNVANTISTNTVEFWVKPTTNTASMVNLTATQYITAASGTISATNFTSPIYYVNGKITALPTLTANIWNHIAVTTSSAISANATTLGKANSAFTTGLIDQVRIYNYARSPAQIAWDYNKGAPSAWYKFDECQGNIAHSTQQTANSSSDGTITIGTSGTQSVLGTCAVGVGSTTAWGNGSVGKYSASLNFDGTDDFVSVGTGSSANSLSFWVKPTTNTANIIQLATGIGVTATSGVITAPGFTSPTIYVNGVSGTTLTANVWQMVTVTSTTAILPSLTRFGLVGSTYYSGQLDEVKFWNYPLTTAQVKLEYNQGSSIRFGP